MDKNRLLRIIVFLIVLIVFVVIGLLVPTVKTDTFWLALSFGVFSILVQEVIWIFAWSKAACISSKFLRIPIIQVGTIYLVLQLIVSLVFMSFSELPLAVPLVLSILLLAACSLFCVGGEVGSNYVGKVEKQTNQKHDEYANNEKSSYWK